MSTTISLIGASGRMGQLAIPLIEKSEGLSLHSKLGSGNSLNECLGADLLIDFTNPAASERIVDFVLEHNLRLLIGTSGWSKQKLEQLESKMHGSSATIVVVPNFSVGSVLATKFAAEASKYFDGIEIIETHDAKKLDAPSGTALFTSHEISKARSGKPADHGMARAKGPLFNGIPITSIRIEGKHAEQEVLFTAPNEELFIRHVVTSHEVYAKGILVAIKKTMEMTGLSVGLLSLLEEK